MSEDIHSHPEDEQQTLTPEELQDLEDEILDTAGGTDHPISPNFGC